MTIASNALVIKALDRWARSKGLNIELKAPSESPLIAVIKESDGFQHEIFMPKSVKLHGNEGCLAVKHPRTGELMKEFAKEVLSQEEGVSVKASHFKVDSKKSLDETIDELRKSKDFSEDGELDIEAELKKIDSLIELVKQAAPSKEEADKALKPLYELKELAQIALHLKKTNSETDGKCKCPKCTGISPGMLVYMKSKAEGILLEPMSLKDLPVGTFFFTEDKALYIAVGLEKGKMQDEFINSVVICPAEIDDQYKGKPIKHPLSTTVIPLGKDMPL
ncbi:hypothetical protein KI655_18620 [Vibrio sp. D404a]|uniref:hypothetical protein n=1 Tax=unclassified Vibrio TaxID=2614977 RepID=UPI002554F6B9|nr:MULTISPECIES: hypothetical protein [unclassified Vibrio]MDK9739313.1 hypothetical protein [Vibrio sp. D404a]MDK9797651.1 hypothetical protein [Vibrio sp. D449a]